MRQGNGWQLLASIKIQQNCDSEPQGSKSGTILASLMNSVFFAQLLQVLGSISELFKIHRLLEPFLYKQIPHSYVHSILIWKFIFCV